jgi:septum formation protein
MIYMVQSKKIILASSSPTRQMLLRNVGLSFDIISPSIDELLLTAEAIEQQKPLDQIAQLLACKKFRAVCDGFKDEIIIASDQTLEGDNGPLHKPKSYDDAFKQLWQLRGKRHALHSACAIGHSQKISHMRSRTAYITMRNYSEEFLTNYLKLSEPDYLHSVGGYQIEKYGMHLFEKVEGDYTTIMGLPMLDVLDVLRQLNVLLA